MGRDSASRWQCVYPRSHAWLRRRRRACTVGLVLVVSLGMGAGLSVLSSGNRPERSQDDLIALAAHLVLQGHYDDAHLLLVQAIDIERRNRGDVSSDLWTRLAELEHRRGDLVASEPLYRLALAARKEETGPDHLSVAAKCTDLGKLLEDRGAYAEAEFWYRRSLEIRTLHLPPTHHDLASSANDLGRILETRGQPQDALALYEEATRIWSSTADPDAWLPAWFLSNRGAALLELGRVGEAGPILREAHRRLSSTLGPEHLRTHASAERVADWLWKSGRVDEARELRADLRLPPGP